MRSVVEFFLMWLSIIAHSTRAIDITRLPKSADAGATPNAILRFDNEDRVLSSQGENGYKVSSWSIGGSKQQFLIRRLFNAPFYNEVFYDSSGTDTNSLPNLDTANGPRDKWDRKINYGSIAVFENITLGLQEAADAGLAAGKTWTLVDRGIYSSARLSASDNYLFGQDICVVADRYLVSTSVSLSSASGIAALIFDMDKQTMDRFVTPLQILDSGENETALLYTQDTTTLKRTWKELEYGHSVKRVAINECQSDSFTINGRTFKLEGALFRDAGFHEDFCPATDTSAQGSSSSSSSTKTAADLLNKRARLSAISISDRLSGSFERRFANARNLPFGPSSSSSNPTIGSGLHIDIDANNLYIYSKSVDEQQRTSDSLDDTEGNRITIPGSFCHAHSTGDRLILSTPWKFASNFAGTDYRTPQFFELLWSDFAQENYTLRDISLQLSPYAYEGASSTSVLSTASRSSFTARDHFGNPVTGNRTEGCDMVVDVNQQTQSVVVFSELGHLLELNDLELYFADQLQFGISTHPIKFNNNNGDGSSSPSNAIEARGLYIAPADANQPISLYHTTLQYEGYNESSKTHYARFAPDFPSPMLITKTTPQQQQQQEQEQEILITSNAGRITLWSSQSSHGAPLEYMDFGDTAKHVAHISFNPYRESWLHDDLKCQTIHTDEAEELLQASNNTDVFLAKKGPGFLKKGSACGPEACAIADAGLQVYCRRYNASVLNGFFLKQAIPSTKINDNLIVVENSFGAWAIQL